MTARRRYQQRFQIQIKLALDEDAQDRDAGAAQSEGVAGASRFQARAEDAGQGIEAVGQREHDAHRCRRQHVAGVARQVVLNSASATSVASPSCRA